MRTIIETFSDNPKGEQRSTVLELQHLEMAAHVMIAGLLIFCMVPKNTQSCQTSQGPLLRQWRIANGACHWPGVIQR